MKIEKVQESLQAADLSFENLLYNSSVNRAYYAMLQDVQQALQKSRQFVDVVVN